jgi:hypothetical protein
MKTGGWIPLSKGVLRYLPHDRPFTELEALVSVQIDFDQDAEVTVSGYASLWRWSRGKVNRYLKTISVKIVYPRQTAERQNQRGRLKRTDNEQITDRSRTDSGQIRFIDSRDLPSKASRKGTDKEQKTDRRRCITKEPNTKKENKGTYGEFVNVLLTDGEHTKLREKFNGTADRKIEALSFYVESTGKHYKSHYATILNWARKDSDGKKQSNDSPAFMRGL